MAYAIDIDGYIGAGYNSKSAVKNALVNYEGKPVSVRMSSLGGDLIHGLDIAAQFETHGNITADLFSFNASSSTVAALGAKTVRAHVDSLYLIHKCMSWVDEWGMMNEDDIQAVIDQLTKEKKENEKITLVLANKYAIKTGKSITEILNLMKENTWLTATEAKEWGFIDEIFGEHNNAKVNVADIKARFNAVGLPMPKRLVENAQDTDGSNLLVSLFNSFKKEISDLFFDIRKTTNKDTSQNDNTNPENPITNMKKDWNYINTILGKEGIEETEGKVNITIDEMEKINSALDASEKAKANAEKDLTSKVNELAKMQKEFDDYKNAAGDKTNPVPKPTDGDDGSGFENSFAKTMANAKSWYDAIPDDK